MVPRVAELWRHPVKSLRGMRVERVELDALGVRHDRRFLVVDREGKFLTQRELPTMTLVRTVIDGETLLLRAEDASTVRVPLEPGEDGPSRDVVVWNDTVRAVEPSPEASALLTRVLGTECALVGFPPSSVREVPAEYAERARPGARVGFADAFPLLVANPASLADLERQSGTKLAMERFRPNVVIEGWDAWAEDRSRAVRIGAITLHLVKPCSRCAITTIDPDTGARGPEPLRTMAETRRDPERPSKVLFAMNAIHDREGTIAVGDPVEVIG